MGTLTGESIRFFEAGPRFFEAAPPRRSNFGRKVSRYFFFLPFFFFFFFFLCSSRRGQDSLRRPRLEEATLVEKDSTKSLGFFFFFFFWYWCSLFVLLKGRSREEAFRIGGEIVEEVSRTNPPSYVEA